ncbi:MAG: hypothetical protein EOO20_06250 [Chryseobacterium sp.]|nr:MAG: hypothetical protein EOO20_06250 [Chryseobacterium sp.]
MQYKKGESGNPNGKPKGAKNKSLTEKLNSHIDKVSLVLARATTEERNEFLLRITTIVLTEPKRTRIRAKSNSNSLIYQSTQNIPLQS